MSRFAKIARRSFLIGSAAIVGGVAFGYYQYRRDPDNPLLPDADPGKGEATQASLSLSTWARLDRSALIFMTCSPGYLGALGLLILVELVGVY